MKILMLTIDFPPDTTGGEGIVAEKTALLLHAKGIDIQIIAPAKNNSSDYDQKSPLNIKRVNIYGKTFLTKIPSFIMNTKEIVKNFDGDIIYTLRPCFINKKIKTVFHMHTTRYAQSIGCLNSRQYLYSFLNFIYIPFDLWMISKSNNIIVLTQKMKKEILLFSNKKHHHKIKELGNGIDTHFFYSSHTKNFLTNKILYVGRLDSAKGIFILLKAFKNIVYKKNASLYIAGEGPIKNQIITFIKKYNLQKNIYLLGKIPFKKMPLLYNNHDLVILPSFSEGYPLTTLEAMACGTPIITSDICEYLGQPMFKTGNVQDLVKQINKLLFNKKILHNLSQRQMESIRQYSWDNIIKQLIDILQGDQKDDISINFYNNCD